MAAIIVGRYPGQNTVCDPRSGCTGFAGQAEVRQLSWEHRVDPETWWREVYLAGVSSNGAVIGRQDSATVARIKHEFDRLAAAYAAVDGLVALPAVALLASASR